MPDETIAGMRKTGEYLRIVFAMAFRDYAWIRDFTVGLVTSSITLALCVRFRLGAADDWSKHRWFLIIAVLAPYLFVIAVHISWRIIKAATEMHRSLSDKLHQQVSITGIKEDDPRIEPSFFDGRHSAIEQVESLELKNYGPRAAYQVRLAPLRLKKRTVYFPDLADSIPPTDFRHFYADVGSQWGMDDKQKLIKALSEEWASYDDHETRREVLVPARIDFEDETGVRFECSFTLLYHGGRGWNQPADFKCIECQNITYRRIPLGVTPPI